MPTAFRRSHRKSRQGCSVCKQRRVKCDETRPQCQTCIRRKIVCKYPSSVERARSPASPLTPGSSITSILPAEPKATSERRSPEDGVSAVQPKTFDYYDLSLLSHFHAEVCATLDEEDDQPLNWSRQTHSPLIDHPLVVHALLAFSALHRARLYEHTRELCLQKAFAHHTTALSHMIDALPLLNEDTSGSLLLGGILLCLYNFASGPQSDQFIAFSSDTEPEHIYLLKGVRSIILNGHGSVVKHLLQPQEKAIGDEALENPLSTGANQSLSSLLTFAEEQGVADAYASTLKRLMHTFSDAFSNHPAACKTLPSHKVFEWLYFLEPEYLTRLQTKEPLALLIFAHFDVLLHFLRHLWYLEGWSLHIMEGIYRHLQPEYRSWLDWPWKATGWSPRT